MRLRVSILAPAIIGAILLVPASASAITRHAAPEGTGGHPCASADPCPIEEAVDGAQVVDGDVVLVAPGEYELTDTLEVNHRITVQGHTGPAATISNATGGVTVWVKFNGALLADLRIVAEDAASAWALDLDRGRGERLEVVASGSGNIACNVRLDESFVPRPYLRDSICRASGTDAVALGGRCTGISPTVTRHRIRNVTVIATGSFSDGVRLDLTSVGGCKDTLDLVNVIAQGDRSDLYAEGHVLASTSARIEARWSAYDDSEAVGPNAFVTPAGAGDNITEPALFVDFAGGDLRQAAGSPTIDAGNFLAGQDLGSFDIDGEFRFQGTDYDIGADEFDSPPDTIIDSGPSGSIDSGDASFAYSGFPPSDTVGFQCRLDGGGFEACPSAGIEYTGLVPGGHVFAVRAVDGTGNVDPTPAIRTWTVEGEASAGRILIPGRRLKLKPNRVMRARLRCAASAGSPPCGGKLRVKVRKPVRFRGKRRRPLLATTRYAVRAGQAKRVKLRLAKPKARLLRSTSRARKVRAIARSRGAAGSSQRVVKPMRVRMR